MASSGQDKTAKGEIQRLDLGLEGIISTFNQKPAPEEKVSVVEAPKAETPEKGKELDEFERLAASDRWDALYKFCEKQIAQGGAQAESDRATLWWIRAQLKQKSVPGMMLSAPLDSISKRFVEQNGHTPERLRELCSELLLELGESMFGGTEKELGVTFLERSFTIDTSKRERVAVLLKRPELEPLKGKQMERLREHLSALKEKVGEQAPVEKEKDSKDTVKIPTKVEKSKSANSKSLVLATLLLLALGLYVWPPTDGADFETSVALALDSETAELLSPQAKRSREFSELDAIYYRMAKVSSIPVSNQRNGAESAPAERAASRKKEIVNTDTPLEQSAGTSAAAFSDRTARHDPQSSYPTDMRPIGDNVYVVPHEERDGTVVGAYPVEKYDAPRFFLILARAKVLSRPSYFAEEIASLEQGARVEVARRIGPWLELRSRKGRPGFILAQDAKESR